MTIGSAIKKHRTSRGWSLRRLARLIGYSHVAIMYWERESHEPRPAAIERLEAVFGLPTGSLNE